MLFLPKKISSLDKSFFYRVFANLISAEFSLTDIFEILQHDMENPRFAKVVKRIHQDLKRNVPLHDCFALQSKHFGKLAPELIRLCDEYGALKAALLMLARDQEWNGLIKKVRKNIMVWPLIYLTAIILLLDFMITFVIPVFEQMFRSFGSQLPLITRFTMTITQWWWIVPTLLIATTIVWLLKKYINWLAVIVDWTVVKLPLMGKLSKKIAAAKFAHTFALLAQTNVPMARILGIAAQSVDNRFLAKKFAKIVRDVNTGASLSKALRDCAVVPKKLTQIAKIKEQGRPIQELTGWIEVLYSEIYVEDLMKFQENMQFLLKWIIGIAIGIVAISLYLPLFQMGSAL